MSRHVRRPGNGFIPCLLIICPKFNEYYRHRSSACKLIVGEWFSTFLCFVKYKHSEIFRSRFRRKGDVGFDTEKNVK